MTTSTQYEANIRPTHLVNIFLLLVVKNTVEAQTFDIIKENDITLKLYSLCIVSILLPYF